MKICVFSIISFINFISCCSHQNITHDSYSLCPVKLFRGKRAIGEYTRWRANIESTPEFIVKILDEDIPSPKSKNVIAVNIQPITKRVEKIIIGGAAVTKPVTKPVSPTLAETLKDYTRFVPPTTVATRVDGNFYLTPIQPAPLPKILKKSKVIQMAPHSKNPQRDESPPAKPLFLQRSPIPGVHQYAPITPVGFTRRTKDAPVTPSTSTTDYYSFHTTNSLVQRTIPFEEIIAPLRTIAENNDLNFHHFEEDNDEHITRTTFKPQHVPHHTRNDFETTSEKESVIPTTEKNEDHYEVENKEEEKSSDSMYSLSFYNYDENESSKKEGKASLDHYDYKLKIQEEQRIKEIDDTTRKEAAIFRAQKDPGDKSDDQRLEDNTVKNNMETDVTTNSITMKKGTNKSMKEIITDKRRQACSMIKLRELSFISPRTLPEIEAKLKEWAENSPVAKWVDITDGNFTTLERPIHMMIVDDPSSGQIITAKETVMIVAGMAGRDQHAVTSAMYVLHQLIERSEAHTDLLSKYRFWVIPVFNPDGYDYSITFPHRREWAKNLRQNWDICKGRESCHTCEAYGLRCTIQPCYGVNLDRNFEHQWIPAEELRTEHPCGSLYAGERQLSEIETSAFTKYLSNQERTLFTFIAFKEGDVLGVMYPYSHTRKKRAHDDIYKKRASRAAAAAYSISGRPYVAGQTSEFLPLFAGGIEDWIDSHLGVDNTYTIMMFRPADTYKNEISTERVAQEAFAAMDTLVLQSTEQLAPIPPVTMVRARGSSQSISTPSTLLILVLIVYTCLR